MVLCIRICIIPGELVFCVLVIWGLHFDSQGSEISRTAECELNVNRVSAHITELIRTVKFSAEIALNELVLWLHTKITIFVIEIPPERGVLMCVVLFRSKQICL